MMNLRRLTSCRALVLVASLLVVTAATAAPKPESPAAPLAAEQYKGVPRSVELNEQGVAAVHAKNFTKAEQLFTEALKVDGANGTAAVNLGAVLVTLKQTDKAIALLHDYTERYPQDPALWARYADSLFVGKKLPEAIKAYEKAKTLDPKFSGISSRLGTVYALLGKFPDAEKMFLQAVEENPRDGQALASLSNLFLGNGKADKAISTAKRALQVQPTKELYLTLGSAYEVKKDYRNSVIALERARDLGAEEPNLAQRIEVLKKRSTL